MASRARSRSPRPGDRLRRVARAAAVAVLSLAAVEWTLRLSERASHAARRALAFGPDSPVERLGEISEVRDLVAAAPMSLAPGSSMAGYTLNPDGLRTPPYRRMPLRGVRRVVLIGYSVFAENCGVLDAAHVATVLGRELAKSRRAEVVNLAVSGTGPKFMLRMLEIEGMRIRPDLVVVSCFVSNDLTDEPERLDWYPAPVRFAARWRTWRLVRNAVTMARWRAWNRSLPAAPSMSEDAWLAQERGRGFLYVKPWPRWLEEHAAGLERTYDRMAGLARRGRFPLVILLVPAAVQVDAPLAAAVAAGRPDRSLDLDLPTRRLRALFARTGLPVIDLTPVYRAEAARGREVFQARDGHWNALGQLLAARAIARYADGLK